MERSIDKLRNYLLPIVCWLSATFVYGLSADTLTLFFVGDLMQHKAQISAARRPDGRYDYAPCFTYVSSEIQKADLAVGNLEVPLGGRPYSGYPNFSAPDEFVRALYDAGFDVLLLANNHCLDRGNRGICRTISVLDTLEIPHTGVFRDSAERERRCPLMVEKKGFRIVFLNYTYGTNGLKPASPVLVNYLDKEQIQHDVATARSMSPDAIIACVHWGIEYQLQPRKQERDLARWMLELGVDHIIGSHPHVVQPLEIIPDSVSPNDHLVAYSLGNFISNMRAPQTDGGMAVRMTLKKVGGHTRMVSCGYSFVWTSRPNFNGKGAFLVYPSSVDSNLLNNNEKVGMKRFLKEARRNVEKYSKGIKEYFF